MSKTIDSQTEAVARQLAKRDGQSPNYPWEIEGGGYVPGWTAYISEAVKLIRQTEIASQIKPTK